MFFSDLPIFPYSRLTNWSCQVQVISWPSPWASTSAAGTVWPRESR